jgi:hypothetical protein
MDHDGKASIPFARGGFVDIYPAALISNPLASAKVFPDHEAADSESKHLGWVVVDGNHRCAECWEREQKTQEASREVGAYIDLPEGPHGK